MIEAGVLKSNVSPSCFQQQLGATSRLTVILKNGHLPQALATIDRLGFVATGEGHVVTVPLPLQEKARVIGALACEGIEIVDFDVERI
jgi:hypothetical protein